MNGSINEGRKKENERRIERTIEIRKEKKGRIQRSGDVFGFSIIWPGGAMLKPPVCATD